MISIYNSRALETLIRDEHQRRLFCNSFFKKVLPPDVCLGELPEPVRANVVANVQFDFLELINRRDSERDGATKLVCRCLCDGMRIETVILRIGTGRTSLCISSQAGCDAGCIFCATGQMGFTRDLTAAEMLSQVLLAKRLLRAEGRDLRNVVFMGTGEPLRNETEVYAALDVLRDPQRFYFADSRLTVSTVGIPDAIRRFAERFPNAGLAVSLHSARQQVRERLMPVARKHTLPELRVALDAVKNRKLLMVEILLLKGINDGPEDLAALIDFLRGTGAHVNLIDFNPFPGAPFDPVSKEAREAFGAALQHAGFKVTFRYSLGADISAACGQLAGS